MEASVSVGPPPRERAAQHRLLRLGTDDQLVALFRKGFDEAFDTIHDRYRAPLFGYTRQMLRHSNADAEDAVQEVFLRASRSLREDDREVILRAWLYRVAHNYCFDQLRRPGAAAVRPARTSARSPHRDPALEAEQRESFRRLVTDLERLPGPAALGAPDARSTGCGTSRSPTRSGSQCSRSSPGLNRARGNLKAANEAREAACADIRADLDRAHGRKVRMSGRSRRHLSDCTACTTYKADLRRADQTTELPRSRGPGDVRRAHEAPRDRRWCCGRRRLGRRDHDQRQRTDRREDDRDRLLRGPCRQRCERGSRKCRAAAPRGCARPRACRPGAEPARQRRRCTHVDPRGPAQAGSVYATRSYPTARAPKVAAITPGARVAVRVLEDRAEARDDDGPLGRRPGADELHEHGRRGPSDGRRGRARGHPGDDRRPGRPRRGHAERRDRRRRHRRRAGGPERSSRARDESRAAAARRRPRRQRRPSSPTPVLATGASDDAVLPRRRRRRPSPGAAPGASTAAASASTAP